MATEAARRRIRALGTMERVKRMETEQKARDSAAIRDRMNRMEREKQALLRRISQESRVDGVEGAAYLGRFIRSIRAEIERLDAEMARLRPELNRAEERLRAAMAEQKTFEILKVSRIAAEHRAEKKREAARLDEIALQSWRQ
ncbi:flagellar export protein FliJ [Pseudooceanicola nanhaiensis]|jgi:flagellar export protein FliJ|uniref:flagellar export protein FliJ n=1 Tax=Pseudooceanicola nanhaiensis TaxID=375761 RepID=UPI0040584E66